MTRSPIDQKSARQAGGDLEHQIDGLEHHLAGLQDQVQRLQRLASLGTVSAMLAHEFNNILTPIVSYAQYALKRDDHDLMRTALDKTLTNSRRMTELCERVLGLASDDSMGPRNVAIRPLAVDAAECLGRDLEKDNIELITDVPPDLPAHVHAGHLQQVLFNLVLNARQALLGRRGRLTISGRPTDDGRIVLTVSDNGPGIKAEDLDRVFEPFFTTKRQHDKPDRRGIGLGLPICQQLVEDMGGTITVESEPGRGAAFTLTIPAGRQD